MLAGRASAPRQPKGSLAPSGRVFATQVEEPAVPDDVVAGIISINGTRASALFDTGASHSFIDASFAKTHGIEIIYSPDYWWVNAPEHSFSVHEECLAYPVQIVIDCESKVITFREPNQEELVYRACKILRFAATISAARERKMIKGGCVVYLATMVEAQKEHPKLEDIRVVCEFPNVFPAELPELPPD
uniref:Reverse transcriptase/retrotransposon-derived protein RNase H-like domain-containing protein n=1 Tax=Ananas comosus var. bracteatus TaxID=296719 RepID=A0A6V7P9H2_ANACO|nr:unnamed protein product [Ananas comosus var. bracteatus]